MMPTCAYVYLKYVQRSSLAFNFLSCWCSILVGDSSLLAYTLLLTSLIDGRALSNAVIVAFPDYYSVYWKAENTLDCFTATLLG